VLIGPQIEKAVDVRSGDKFGFCKNHGTVAAKSAARPPVAEQNGTTDDKEVVVNVKPPSSVGYVGGDYWALITNCQNAVKCSTESCHTIICPFSNVAAYAIGVKSSCVELHVRL
jgi:hypothetical protein